MQREALILSIDPSTTSLGYAVHRTNGDLLSAGTIKSPGGESMYAWLCRSVQISHKLGSMAEVTRSNEKCETRVHALIEVPMAFGSVKGMASKNSDSIQKVYACVGAVARDLAMRSVWIWGVSPAWKGHVPKDIMVKRCHRYLSEMGSPLAQGILNMRHDAAEAVLLGAYGLDHLLKEPEFSFRAPIEFIM